MHGYAAPLWSWKREAQTSCSQPQDSLQLMQRTISPAKHGKRDRQAMMIRFCEWVDTTYPHAVFLPKMTHTGYGYLMIPVSARSWDTT